MSWGGWAAQLGRFGREGPSRGPQEGGGASVCGSKRARTVVCHRDPLEEGGSESLMGQRAGGTREPKEQRGVGGAGE